MTSIGAHWSARRMTTIIIGVRKNSIDNEISSTYRLQLKIDSGVDGRDHDMPFYHPSVTRSISSFQSKYSRPLEHQSRGR